MSEVKRYDPTPCEPMLEFTEGGYVSFTDYAALEQERDRLREKLEVIASDCETVSLSEIVDKSEKRTWLSIAKRIRSALGGEGVKE